MSDRENALTLEEHQQIAEHIVKIKSLIREISMISGGRYKVRAAMIDRLIKILNTLSLVKSDYDSVMWMTLRTDSKNDDTLANVYYPRN